MKIAFFGLKQAFNYYQIGGTESFVRRLAIKMVQQQSCRVDYILYGTNETKEIEIFPNLRLRYFERFEDAISAISGNYDHIMTTYLLPKHRFKYASSRGKNKKSSLFHLVYFGWPDSLVKRKLYFGEARLCPYNGKLFCISQRQYEYVKGWAENVVYILPPVPEDYFLRPEDKPKNDKIKLTFLGRIDLGKGIEEVIHLFKALRGNSRFECAIHGIHLPEDKRSLEIHNRLKQQTNIKYIDVDRQNYSPGGEEMVKNVLKETDIFIQPYQRLSSTIDTPVLLLEAMASLCAVITKPFGNIPDIYGKSNFLIPEKNSFIHTLNLLRNLSVDMLSKERERIYEQNLKLNFRSENIANIFLESLKACRENI